MSFLIGSVYFLVDAQYRYYLFVAGAAPDRNPTYSPVGTIYVPGSDLRSRQQLRQTPMNWAIPLVLSIQLSSLLPGSASYIDNYVDRIVGTGDRGAVPRDVNDWWYSLMNNLFESGIIELPAKDFAPYVRANATAAMQSYQRTGKRTSLSL